MNVICKQYSCWQRTKMHTSMCYFGNFPALFLCSWQYLLRPITNFFFQLWTKWICEDGCRQPLLHFSHSFSTELCRSTPDLAVFPDLSSKFFKGKPSRTIHRSTHTQEPECMHKHMFLWSFYGFHRSECFFSSSRLP